MYKLIKCRMTGKEYGVFVEHKDGSKTCIPFVENNSDYQAYLAWVTEGGQVLPADE